MKKFFIFSTATLFPFALLWNGLVHGVLLRESNESLSYLRRINTGDFVLMGLIATLVITFLFTVSFWKWKKIGSFGEHVSHVFFFSAIAGVFVDMNQYMLYPIPGNVVFLWFLFGFSEFCVYQWIANYYHGKFIENG
ncbi:hypothetical protein EHQ12_15940 [Leptospira gomenensis]|uniref:Uncharacterized protein n=1 Tax=Leptospira gomenensis TaxID=2484974 RepID=A0A5F1YC93_9LEPT|nr:hypothetical protein [Leptospira gomenensis]TGK35087.1 hypothetical protein EHQ12_15940 [Leptospira gomenensis]TGK35235.1 hypothetical protein EHQ17_07285 [Leptospira gomenensis]TGK41096.1 hypothetical protein EHQ07_17045 [Leptospira gomenensis]TGK67632.1 hypothetical protein EHQ13_01780 [Leptospira gomenensis]